VNVSKERVGGRASGMFAMAVLLMCMSDAGTGVEELCPTFRRVGLSSRGSAYGGLHQSYCEVGH
jgi:hypothetical protein